MLRTLILLALAGCSGPVALTPDDTGPAGTGAFDVVPTTDPDPPVAGSPTEVTLAVVGPDGGPVEDIQPVHERLLHTFLISRDLSTFAHLHHEDFAEVTVDDLRSATYHFPYDFPLAGDWLLYYEFASRNVYHLDQDWVVAEGSPPMAAAPTLDTGATVTVGDTTAELVWDTGPTATGESAFHLHLTDAGGEVTDIVPWLGADGHGAVASEDLAYVNHLHAWVPGLDAMAPTMAMPHLYDGPDLPFRVTLAGSGRYALWIQFARAADPATPITIPLAFDVP